MQHTDNPVADYGAYSTLIEEQLKEFPKCKKCDEPIREDMAYFDRDDRIWICDDCISAGRRLIEND